ncbi:MAG: hypothetical protein LBI77_02980 [Puniceicoccales bacterium]|jgi:hypothetical protein|nr:hypothetical protein [Puniceicoccales bacterium]
MKCKYKKFFPKFCFFQSLVGILLSCVAIASDTSDTSDTQSNAKESLFLKARGPYKALKEDKDQYSFEIGEEKYEQGKYICIANPTYDLTFKSLFVGIDDIEEEKSENSPQKAKQRLISLLNSLFYPEAENNSNEVHVISVEVVDGTIKTLQKLGDTETKANTKVKSKKLKTGEIKPKTNTKSKSKKEKSLTELRCDVVCQCKVGSVPNTNEPLESELCALYFDIEMQRVNQGNPIRRFLSYQEKLKNRYRPSKVYVIGFLDYSTNLAVEKTKMGRLVQDPESKKLVAAPEEQDIDLQPMIGLKNVIGSILEGKDIEIMKNQKIGQTGKEWLKLLGVRWWAKNRKKNEKDQYYIVPAEPQSQEVKEALNILKMNSEIINEKLFKQEVNRIFDAEEIANAIRAEGELNGERRGQLQGELKGRLQGIMRNFAKNREIGDDEIEGFEKNSLEESFVGEVWKQMSMSNVPNAKNVNDFIQFFRNKGLMRNE